MHIHTHIRVNVKLLKLKANHNTFFLTHRMSFSFPKVTCSPLESPILPDSIFQRLWPHQTCLWFWDVLSSGQKALPPHLCPWLSRGSGPNLLTFLCDVTHMVSFKDPHPVELTCCMPLFMTLPQQFIMLVWISEHFSYLCLHSQFLEQNRQAVDIHWGNEWKDGVVAFSLWTDEACKSQNFPVIILRWWAFQHLYGKFKSLSSIQSVNGCQDNFSVSLSIQAAIICSNNYIICFLLFTSNILKPSFPQPVDL